MTDMNNVTSSIEANIHTLEDEEVLQYLITHSKTSKTMELSLGLSSIQSEIISNLLSSNLDFCIENNLNLIKLCMSNGSMYYSPQIAKQHICPSLKSVLSNKVIQSWDKYIDDEILKAKNQYQRGGIQGLDIEYNEIETLEIQKFNQSLVDKLRYGNLKSIEKSELLYMIFIFFNHDYNLLNHNYEKQQSLLIPQIQSIQNQDDQILKLLQRSIPIFENLNEMKTWFNRYIKAFQIIFQGFGSPITTSTNPLETHTTSTKPNLSQTITPQNFINIIQLHIKTQTILIQFDNSPDLDYDFLTNPNDLKPLQNLISCLISQNTRIGVLTNLNHLILIFLFPKGIGYDNNQGSDPEIRYKVVNFYDEGLTMNWLVFYILGILDDVDFRFREDELDEVVLSFEDEISKLML
ncbi:hypothetical protein BN7_3267 [Wickerhamomyces ciferrii]|uniref:Uncharacterized protein n=1 Tax=Wickerhamomyces ciferrii (strain ATCC 14091 / BCRC 22168 / CBS 111 / JCM 3599 / NBRC 0793 / NRRL Y-1031 F-60-10) TaxID=1206466 RepID=K0KR01_WICCF|nr:uncharacterized protein BN7_3267 [Wickerhamomyces ciferrii]CCH43713.1 hypothetical protein BN7_3267 [Wickerhamomyces ciferrii]